MNWSLPVHELDKQLKRTIRITCGVIVFLSIGLIWDPKDPLLLGMVIGIATGLYNSCTLAQRIRRMVDMGQDSARRHMRQGLTMRIALVVAVVFFCGRTGAVSVYGVGAGILAVSVITVIDNFFSTVRRAREEKVLYLSNK